MSEEESGGDFDFKPRKPSKIPEPEPENISSQSISSTFSKEYNQAQVDAETENQKRLTHMLQGILPSKAERGKFTYSPKNLQIAVDTNNVDEILKQATLMLTGLSYQFASIMKQIDANEEKIAKLEQTYLQQKKNKMI